MSPGCPFWCIVDGFWVLEVHLQLVVIYPGVAVADILNLHVCLT